MAITGIVTKAWSELRSDVIGMHALSPRFPAWSCRASDCTCSEIGSRRKKIAKNISGINKKIIVVFYVDPAHHDFTLSERILPIMISKALVIVPIVATFITSLAAAAALGMGGEGIQLDRRVEQACHREVKKKSPAGHRDLKTHGYSLETPSLGLAAGSLMTEFRPNRWSPVNWTCRIQAKSGRVLRVEFSWPRGGSRLKAISSAV